MIHGVLFDYSGTLFHFEPGPGWPSVTADDAARERLTSLLTAPTLSGEHLPPDLVDAWERRDLDPDVHHAVYMATIAASGVSLTDEQADAVYVSLTTRRPGAPTRTRRPCCAGCVPPACRSRWSATSRGTSALCSAGTASRT